MDPKEIYEEWFYQDLQDFLELQPRKDIIFIIGDWNANIGSQEIPGVTGKFGLGVQNEAGQRLTEFCQENTLVIGNARNNSTHGHHHIVNTEIRLIIFFAAEDGGNLYSHKKKIWSRLWLRS